MIGAAWLLFTFLMLAEIALFATVAVLRRDRWLPRYREWRRALGEAHSSMTQGAMAAAATASFAAAAIVGVEFASGAVGTETLLATAAVGGLLLLGMTSLLVAQQGEMAGKSARSEALIAERLGQIVEILDSGMPSPKPREPPQTTAREGEEDEPRPRA